MCCVVLFTDVFTPANHRDKEQIERVELLRAATLLQPRCTQPRAPGSQSICNALATFGDFAAKKNGTTRFTSALAVPGTVYLPVYVKKAEKI